MENIVDLLERYLHLTRGNTKEEARKAEASKFIREIAKLVVTRMYKARAKLKG
jgi:hypothetical protein